MFYYVLCFDTVGEHLACKYIEWWGAGMVMCLKWGAYGPADATATPSCLASLRSRLVSPFWCWLIQVVLEKRQLNGCLDSVAFLLCCLWYMTQLVMSGISELIWVTLFDMRSIWSRFVCAESSSFNATVTCCTEFYILSLPMQLVSWTFFVVIKCWLLNE